ncbi:MAG: Wzz/FepE/Etk N-terminal domain-containing protein, partial [Pseudomonadota bacterium]
MSTTKPDAGGAGAQAPIPEGADDEISLLEMLQVLWERKWLLIGSTLGAGVRAAGIALLMPNYYTATAQILPPQQNSSSASALLGQLGGLAAAAGGNIAGIRNPNDLYVGMLKSRTVADRLIERFDLKTHFEQKSQMTTQVQLASASRLSAGRDGIIAIAVELKDPNLAADVANAYVEELVRLTAVLAVTEAAQRRLFFERQLAKARDNLAAAEVAAREALTKGGLAMVEGQGRSLVETSARLRAQITAKEVQIGAMRSFAADSNPDLQRDQRDLTALRGELARAAGSGASGAVPKSNPAASDNVRLLREVRSQEALEELLA